jgi:alpha-D-xyloside xylohydrolase
MGPRSAQSTEDSKDPTEIRVYPGANGRFTYYEDGGDGYGYERGAYAKIRMSYDASIGGLTLGRRRGRYRGMPRSRRLRVVFVGQGHGTGATETPRAQLVTYHGGQVVVRAGSGPGP